MTERFEGGHRRVDRVLADDVLAELPGADLARLRVLRSDAMEEEAEQSYVRRLLQGRLDIVRAEQDRRRRRAAGETNVGSLVDDLPRILADAPSMRGPEHVRPRLVDPSRTADARRTVERLATSDSLLLIVDMGDGDLEGLVGELSEAEISVSKVRHALHEVIDAISAEVVRRYRDGDADVADLLPTT